jgi:hypothetical protein
MSIAIDEPRQPAVATADDAEESCFRDVVGLSIPRKRLLATVQIEIDARGLPRRKPRASVQQDADEEAM